MGKKSRGRPKLSDVVVTERCAFCLEKPLADVLKEASLKEEKPVSLIIRNILRHKFKVELAKKFPNAG